MFQPSPARSSRKVIDQAQTGFKRGYVSTLADSRIPPDALSDMTNAELAQDGLPRPRPPLAPYGPESEGTVLGIGTFTRVVDGQPERWMISMQVVEMEIGSTPEEVGRIHVSKDGEPWELIDDADNVYDPAAAVSFEQHLNRVYVSNMVDQLSYLDLSDDSVVSYDAISNPSTPTAAKTGLTGTTYTYYYRVSANSEAGESAASASDSETVGKVRDQWVAANDFITVTWSAVTDAISYNVYGGDNAFNLKYLGTVTGLSFKDDGTAIPNPFKIPPEENSTEGPTVGLMYNKNAQLYGVLDANDPYKLWYSGVAIQGQPADFTGNTGGGWVGIDYGGPSVPIGVRSFRDGRGNPALTVLSRGQNARLYHVTFQDLTLGDTIITFPNVYDAGPSDALAPYAVLEEDNSLFYPTPVAFKSTRTRPNLLNILTTDSVSQAIEPDVQRLRIEAMDKARGLAHEGKLYWSLPVGNDENSEMWIMDLTRKGAWILRWTVPAKFLWLYEDNAGLRHFCVLVDNEILEFTRSTTLTQDNGVPFRSRVAGGANVYDAAGVSLAFIIAQRFKLLYPKGRIQVNVYGLRDDGIYLGLASKLFEPAQYVPFTAYGQYEYSGSGEQVLYGQDVGAAPFTAKPTHIIPLAIDEIVNELKWEVITDDGDCDYILSSVQTQGRAIKDLYLGDDEL